MKNEIVVQKLHAYCTKIMDYCSGRDFEQFMSDSQLVEACVFNLSQMGELCRVVDKSFAKAHPEIAWNGMYGLRNRIVHDHDGIKHLPCMGDHS